MIVYLLPDFIKEPSKRQVQSVPHWKEYTTGGAEIIPAYRILIGQGCSFDSASKAASMSATAGSHPPGVAPVKPE